MSSKHTDLGAMTPSFESEYYRTNYRDYASQNPPGSSTLRPLHRELC